MHVQLFMFSNTSYSVNVVLVKVTHMHSCQAIRDCKVCESHRERLFTDFCDYTLSRSLRRSSPTLGVLPVERVVDEPPSRLSSPTLAAAAGRE